MLKGSSSEDEYECIFKKKEKQRHKRQTRSSSLQKTRLLNHSTVSEMQTKTVPAGVSANPHHFQTSLANQSTASHVSSSHSHETNVTSVTASETEQPTAPELANTKEISPMFLIDELTRFNKITHQYTLVDEQGTADEKQLYMELQLGDKDAYSASDPTITKALQAVAATALEKTAYKHPPPKVIPKESFRQQIHVDESLEQPSSQKVKDAVPESADEDDLKKLHSPKKKKRKRSKLREDSLTDEQPSSLNSRLNDHVPTASRGVKQLSNSGAPNCGSETVKSKPSSSHKTTITDDGHREATTDSGNTIKSTSKNKRCEADGVPKITRISGDICEELHGCNKVGWQFFKRMKESMKERGTPVRTGTWLPEEDQFLRENIARFHEANPSVDVHELLFGDAGDVKKRLSLIKETEFYKKMCVGLMRTNYSCYQRVRLHLYANYKVAGAFSADDLKRLRVLYNRYGSNWYKIGEELGRKYESVFAKWSNMQKEKHGEWSSSEKDNLIEAVQSYIQDKKGDTNKAQDRMPWTELCKSVPGRSPVQCRQHWMRQLRTQFLTGTFAEMWKKEDRCALIEEIIEQNVENESDIDFDQICRNFEGRGRIVSNYFVMRRWRVMKQSVNGHSVQSFPDILDKLAEEFHT